MPDRKHTPDVLGEILGEVALVEPPPVAPSAPAGRPARRPGATRLEDTAPAAKPSRWEYRVVSFQNYRGWRPRYINGGEVANWMAGPLIHDFLQLLGEDGWELAGAGAGHELYGTTDYHQVYLKRPLVD